MAMGDGLEIGTNSSQHSYFVPMVDMLAGVVFLLIIMLASSTLVTRQDFGQIESTKKEIARISAALDAARAKERLYLEPRRRAKLAMGALLENLAASLDKQGFRSVLDVEDGRIAVAGNVNPFSIGVSRLDSDGQRLAEALAEALENELQCLAANSPSSVNCAVYDDVKLETVLLTAPSSDAQVGNPLKKARTLAMLSAVIASSPPLLDLKAEDGADLFSFGLQQGTPIGSDGSVEVHFQMALPPIK